MMLCRAAVLAGVLLLSGSAAGETAAAAPEQVIRQFYRWYVGALSQSREPFKTGRSELQRFVSTRLLRELDRARNAPGGVEADYFLDAQDFDDEWATNIEVSAPAVEGERATAEVRLKGPEVGTRRLHLTMVREQGGWKIDRVEGRS